MYKSKGCEWTGELRELDNHLNSDPPANKSLQGCPFMLIKCPLSCEIKLVRHDMTSHLKDKLFHSERHTLPTRKEFQNIRMQFLNGEQHLNGSPHENGIDQERLFTSNRLVAPVQLIMTDFEQHRKNEDIWYSPGFYTRPEGYMMCLAVYANGWAEGRSKCISVYVHLMRGEFDNKLEWPFWGNVHVQLQSWEEEGGKDSKESHTRVIPFDESAQVLECTASDRVVGGERAELGRGLCKFASHLDVRAKYLKNDCLKIHVYFLYRT
jgi:TNF receptor-associated factor 4